MSRRSLLVSTTAVLLTAGMMMLAIAWGPGNSTSLDQSAQAAFQEPKTEQPATKTGKGKKGKGKGKGKNANQSALPPSEAPRNATEAGVPVLSSGDSYDDFASVTQTKDGVVYAAYAAYYDAHDQIRLHRQLDGGQWSTRTHVPLVKARADIWMPQLASDSSNRVWLIWGEQTEQTKTASGNWDLYARSLDNTVWGPIVRLTDNPKPDINHHVAMDSERNIYVVWQAHPENNGDIQMCRFDGQKWSKPLSVTTGAASDWYPSVAIDSKGTAWVAFDSYRNGDYDVFLTSVTGDKPGEVIPIATSKFYEAHATVACTPDSRVWVAWEQGGFNWAKDQGYWLRVTNKLNGSTIGSTREVQVAAYQDGRVMAGPSLGSALKADEPKVTGMPVLAAGSDGRLWMRYRHAGRGAARANGQGTRFWSENVTHLTSNGWAAPTMLAGSTGRISVFSRIVPAADGGLLAAYSSDQRGPANYHQPIHDQVLVTSVAKPSDPAGSPELQAYQPPAAPTDMQPWDVEREARQVAATRKYRTTVDGQSLRIVRGDLHRHTEMSWDVGPANDGSYLDFYRYMIDVAEMDFGGLTDHQGGGQYAYHWWLTEKSADMYYLAPRFVPLYGYERSARFPNGHRNVFHSYRGVPVFAFQVKLNQTGVFPGVGAGDLVDNDTKLLYEYLRGTGGLAISHTSGTDSMGTDWRDNDPMIEPVVEIYQGARNSYEVIGGPRVHDEAQRPYGAAPGGYQEAGMVWNALAKGYRLGTTSSSDHGATHISYSLVYTPENNRESILESIRKRHTYGATDNLIVEARANGRFMGEEFDSNERPTLVLKAVGTDKIARVDLVRNNAYVYTTSPLKEEIEVKYTDMEPVNGLNYYYFRIQQDNGEVAWASPVWINYKP